MCDIREITFTIVVFIGSYIAPIGIPLSIIAVIVATINRKKKIAIAMLTALAIFIICLHVSILFHPFIEG